ncbi:MAG: response regulator [Verrucomicrobiota bacterium]|nr:response regulator [Verrucomicrobiota bacterium]
MCSVLIVEDHSDTRRALATLLSRWGHTASAADDVKSAISFIDEMSFDVILSDIGLPDGNGYQFLAEIKKRRLEAKTAAVTALSSAADLRAANEAGFDHHFAKPLDLRRLQSWLDLAAAV